MSIRTERITEQLRNEVSVILRDEVTDPRIEMLSITRIHLSRDLSHAQVFWSPFSMEDVDLDDMTEGLASAAPFVRRLVAQRLNLRRTPEIAFHYDPSIGEGDRMLALLKEVGASGSSTDSETADEAAREAREKAREEDEDGAAT